MSESAEVQALEAVLPQERNLTVTEKIVAKDGDKTVIRKVKTELLIRDMPFRRWPMSLNHIVPILAYLPEEGLSFKDEAQVAVWLAQVVGMAHENLIAVACLATDQTPEFFDRISLADGMKVIHAAVMVNKDFFWSEALPLIEGWLPGITDRLTEAAEKLQTIGQTQ